jgi:uncharacterized membrane protein YqjE
MFSPGSIKESLAKFFHLDSLAENLSGYVEARVELLKLEMREELAKAMTRGMVLGIIVLICIFFTGFISLGLALYLNEFFTEKYTGFFLIGGFYLILLLASLLMRKQFFQLLERLINKNLKNPKE